ncbi:hypothetical protein [Streptomyces sp. AC627_RSS907]|uniref:hypothetical protein n=1 Tax=Streptomyces sp. AC627_RSS907 TaxID=2823684 RepID=UPI001C227CD2|nr:hypothetical protein [Streptomyces sp. AC627_RSS907]
MHLNVPALMIVVPTLAVGILLFGRGRPGGPWWMVPAGALVAHPLAHLLVSRDETVDDWLRWSFQLACGVVVASLLGPVYRRLRVLEDRSTAPSERHRLAA